MVGAEVDKLAAGGEAAAFEAAIRDAVAACARVRQLAETHDATVAELVDAATDLGAEPPAPAGPRGTSASIAVKDKTIIHKRVSVTPVGARIRAALQYAMDGDTDRAAAEVRTVTELAAAKRPAHLLRNRQGMLFQMSQLNDGIRSQIHTGDLTELFGHDIDRYMEGTLE
jgi:hypothetical protein